MNLVNKFDGVIDTPAERFSKNFHDIGYFTSGRAGFVDLNEWFSFDPLFFGISPSDASGIDPQQRMLLKVTYEAWRMPILNQMIFVVQILRFS